MEALAPLAHLLAVELAVVRGVAQVGRAIAVLGLSRAAGEKGKRDAAERNPVKMDAPR